MLTASAVIRCKNKASTLERTLLSLRQQTVPVEIITVDSGSTDGSLDIAQRYSDAVLRIPQAQFTYGRALNLGAQAANGDIVFSLSAHCWAQRRDWVAKSLAHYCTANVAGTNGHERLPDGAPLRAPYCQSLGDVQSFPYWGFSNHASSWRRETWSRIPFDEEMPACEDKHWAWRVLSHGHTIVFDPDLHVALAHRRKEGLTALYRRTRREAYAFGRYMPITPLSLTDALRTWWEAAPGSSRRPLWMRRLGHYRLAEITARYLGEQQGCRDKLRYGA